MRQTLCNTTYLFHHPLFGFAYSFHCVVIPIVQVAQSEVRLSCGAGMAGRCDGFMKRRQIA